MPTTSIFAPLDTFTRRHVGPQPASVQKMLEYLGYESMDAFLKDCLPQDYSLEENAIRDEGAGGIWALSEGELLRRAKEIGKKNKVTRSFIGLGYHQAVSQLSRFPLGFARRKLKWSRSLAGSSPSYSSQHA